MFRNTQTNNPYNSVHTHLQLKSFALRDCLSARLRPPAEQAPLPLLEWLLARWPAQPQPRETLGLPCAEPENSSNNQHCGRTAQFQEKILRCQDPCQVRPVHRVDLFLAC